MTVLISPETRQRLIEKEITYMNIPSTPKTREETGKWIDKVLGKMVKVSNIKPGTHNLLGLIGFLEVDYKLMLMKELLKEDLSGWKENVVIYYDGEPITEWQEAKFTLEKGDSVEVRINQHKFWFNVNL